MVGGALKMASMDDLDLRMSDKVRPLYDAVVAFIRDQPDHKSKAISLIALDETASIAAAARSLCGDAINHAALGPVGDDVKSISSPYFQPAIGKYGGVPALLKIGQGALWKKEDGKTAIDWIFAR